jgi:tetratricopeptide (TPR) repeat protein
LDLALRYGKSQWQTGLMVAEIHEQAKKSKQALEILEKYYDLYPSNYYLGLEYARHLNNAGQFEVSIEILKNINVLPNEGATAGRRVWRSSNLNLAIDKYENNQYSAALLFVDAAREFPKNLGVGRTYFTDERLEDFIAALCYDKMNKQTESVTFKNRIIATISDRKDEISWNSSDLITAFLLKEQKRIDDAENLINELAKMNSDDPGTRWSAAIFNENYDAAARIVSENPSVMNRPKNLSFQILLRLHNECGVFYEK